MTQRIFDVENEKDMQDLWDILPNGILRIVKDLTDEGGPFNRYYAKDYCYGGTSFININWHDKTEITRPIQEATEQDMGKLCYFWDNEGLADTKGILGSIETEYGEKHYYLDNIDVYFEHARRLTKQEIEELC